MSSVLFKDFFKEIKNTFNRFISIFAIVALGVGLFAGLKVSSRVMKKSADAYYDGLNFYDLRLVSTVGFTEDDVVELRKYGELSEVEATHTTDALFDSDVGQLSLRFFEKDAGSIDSFLLTEGTFPEKSDECAVDSRLSSKIKIGDKIAVSFENSETVTDALTPKTLTVTGYIRSPIYLSFERGNTNIGNGSLDGFVCVPSSAFDSEYYFEIVAIVKGAKELVCYGDEYKSLVAAAQDRVEEFASEREGVRYESIYEEYSKKINDSQQELDDKKAEAEEKLAAALAEIEQGETKLASAKKSYSDGLKKYNSALAQYEKSYNDFVTAKPATVKKLEALNDVYKAKKSEYDASVSSYQASLASLAELLKYVEALEDAGSSDAPAYRAEYENKKAELDVFGQQLSEAGKKLAEMKAGIDGGYAELDAAEKRLASAKASLDNSAAELAAAKKSIKKGDADMASARAEYEKSKADADNEITDAQKKIDEGRADLEKIERPTYYVYSRTDNTGYSGFSDNSDKIDAISGVFPVFFVIVAGLVCLTTMTRMVEERRVQIGVLKALGYGKVAIAGKYLVYAGLSSLSGSIVGVFLGYWIFPTVIIKTYTMMYDEFPIVLEFNVKYAVLASSVAVLCMCVTTFWACFAALSSVPAQLMRPKPPTSGKKVFLERITPIWKRLSFSHKVSARNLIRYKKRFFMTLIGISGCTALLLTGFGLRDSIGDILPKQFDEIQKYDVVIKTSNPSSSDEDTALNKTLADDLGEDIYVYQQSADLKTDDASFGIYLVVPENPEKLNDFIVFRDRITHKQIDFPSADGVVITEKLSYKFGISVGDKISVCPDGMNTYEFTVGGITENYLYSYVYATPEQYEAAVGSRPEYETVWGIFRDGTDIEATCSEIIGTDNVLGLSKFFDMRDHFNKVLKGLISVVILIIVCASLLAFIVLYNLTNINITERTREIATIKVLGFTDKEVAGYVYRENVVLTLLGSGLGLVLGIFLHRFIIVTAEVDAVMFGRQIHPMSYLFAFAMTIVFSVIVALVMHFRLKNIDMVESLKSVE